jgi:hypothetical protein
MMRGWDGNKGAQRARDVVVDIGSHLDRTVGWAGTGLFRLSKPNTGEHAGNERERYPSSRNL